MEKYIEILLKAPILRGFNSQEILEIIKVFNGYVLDFGKGRHIFEAGKRNELIGIMLSGKAHIIHEEFWGNRNLVSVIEPGQNFGEAYAAAPDSKLNISVIAEKNCKILFLNVCKGIENVITSENIASRFSLNLLRDMARKNIYFAEKLSHVAERTTRNKLISYLSDQSRKNGKKEFDIPFSRQELADYLFIDRSGLSAELCKMRDEGLLDFKKNHFILKNVDF